LPVLIHLTLSIPLSTCLPAGKAERGGRPYTQDLTLILSGGEENQKGKRTYYFDLTWFIKGGKLYCTEELLFEKTLLFHEKHFNLSKIIPSSSI